MKQHIDNNETEHTNNQKTQTFIHDPDDSRIKNKNHEPNLESNNTFFQELKQSKIQTGVEVQKMSLRAGLRAVLQKLLYSRVSP